MKPKGKQKVGRFAVKGYLYNTPSRRKHVNGPWADTIDEAIVRFAEQRKKASEEGNLLFQIFIAKSVPYGTAGANDGKYDYVAEPVPWSELESKLKTQGLKPHDPLRTRAPA